MGDKARFHWTLEVNTDNAQDFQKVVAGIGILSRHGNPILHAEYGVIHAHLPKGEINHEETQIMELFGWHYDVSQQVWVIYV